MNMIERVARAIYGEDTLDGLGGDVRQRMMDRAKATILAMREPTDEMVDCGQDARLDGGGYYDIWRAMIDAALVED